MKVKWMLARQRKKGQSAELNQVPCRKARVPVLAV